MNMFIENAREARYEMSLLTALLLQARERSMAAVIMTAEKAGLFI